MEPLEWSLLLTVGLAGFRHGFDIDHLAAIADISSSASDRSRALLLSTLYAAGHALVLLLLGAAAIVSGERLPAALDEAMGRLVGATLLVLGIYVVYSVVRYGRSARLRGRWSVILSGIQRTAAWLRHEVPSAVEIEHAHPHDHFDGEHSHRHDAETPAGSPAVATRHVHTHRHVVVQPLDPFGTYGGRTAFVVGMVHGVGAETPTQILLLVTAAGFAGGTAALILLGAFVAGLFLANTAVSLGAAAALSRQRRLPVVYVALAVITALISAWVGLAYLLDAPRLLPAWLVG